MMRSLYSGISGLRNHQTRMDVLGNNIANVNTAGYKASRTIFQDIFSQNAASGMANQQDIGGTNPIQIGLGIRLSTVDVLHTRAAFQRTDNATDMMINGDGFFIVAQRNQQSGALEPMYTRAGNFSIDDAGYLVTSHGYFVLGNNFEMVMGIADPGSDEILGVAGRSARTFGPGITIPANFWREGDFIPADTFGAGVPGAAGHTISPADVTAIADYIANGTPLGALSWILGPVDVTYSTPAIQEVRAQAMKPPVVGLVQGADIPGLSPIRVQAMTRLVPRWDDMDAVQQQQLLDAAALPAGSPAQQAALDLFLGQFEEAEVGLPGFSVANNGDVSVILGNRKVVIGRIALAMFSNPPGLEKAGNSLYRESASSGPVVVTEAFLDGAGKIDGGGLEMSNVDLANEFTDMIVTQRGFQANSRIITVSDTMLEELVNLKR